MTALIQNFSVPAGNDVSISLQVDPDTGLTTLVGTHIVWRAYEQVFGIALSDGSPPFLLEKSTTDGSIVILPSPPMECQIKLASGDTASLLRNYYHQTQLIDQAGNTSTINCGIMTVTQTGAL